MEEPNADWERRVDEVWASGAELDEQELLTAIEDLAAELGDESPVAAFERGSLLDSTGHSDLACRTTDGPSSLVSRAGGGAGR